MARACGWLRSSAVVELPCAFAHESNALLVVNVSPPHDSLPAAVCVGCAAGGAPVAAGAVADDVGGAVAAGCEAVPPALSPGIGSVGPKPEPIGVDKSCDVSASSDDVFALSESNIACDILSADEPCPDDTVSAPELPDVSGVAVEFDVLDVFVCSREYSR